MSETAGGAGRWWGGVGGVWIGKGGRRGRKETDGEGGRQGSLVGRVKGGGRRKMKRESTEMERVRDR